MIHISHTLAFVSTFYRTHTFPPKYQTPPFFPNRFRLFLSLNFNPSLFPKMGGMSKLALGATITVALILALFLSLFLLLLADFVSSLVRTRKANSPEAPNPKSPPNFQISKPTTLPSFYAHGVLQAPTSFLLTVPKLEAAAAPPIQPTSPASVCCSLSSNERFVCISNPVYDGVEAREEEEENGMSTPFETPGTSPSHFGEEGEWSPPLRFMKKLPPVRQWVPGSVSATDTNRASSCNSFSSSTLCFSPC